MAYNAQGNPFSKTVKLLTAAWKEGWVYRNILSGGDESWNYTVGRSGCMAGLLKHVLGSLYSNSVYTCTVHKKCTTTKSNTALPKQHNK